MWSIQENLQFCDVVLKHLGMSPEALTCIDVFLKHCNSLSQYPYMSIV